MNASRVHALDHGAYANLVRRALEEDLGSGDVTTMAIVDPARQARAELVAKSDCVLCGLDIAEEAFRQVDPRIIVMRLHEDGARLAPADVVARITGPAGPLLTAERTALNFLQHLSGVATLTRRFVDAAAGRIIVLDTRKTTPTFRALEKYAVRCGGGSNHRIGLYDAILIKDNHVRLAGGVRAAVARARVASPKLTIEVEAQSLDEVDEAIRAGADVVLLDNMSTTDITEAVRRIGRRVKTEISGGVTLSRLPELAATGADYVSVGALTHSAPAADLSLEIEPL